MGKCAQSDKQRLSYEEIVGYKIQSNGTQRSVKTNQFFCDKYSQRKKVAGDQKDEGAAQVL